ncbi:MAG: excalibur calcium-binding domain-containing protein [Methanomicrobiales archaeon]|nr:excalibur calcium-binding domain-containing protein [Methanomicrobiales archaeon]
MGHPDPGNVSGGYRRLMLCCIRIIWQNCDIQRPNQGGSSSTDASLAINAIHHVIQLSLPVQSPTEDQRHRSRGRNSYGHPTSATLGRLAQVGSAIYRTDLNGDVTVTTDGSTYDVQTGQTSSQPIAVIAKPVTTQQPVSSQSSAGAVCDCSYNRYNCGDFSGHTAAQACYDYFISLGKGDIHQLDGDKNGIACEG